VLDARAAKQLKKLKFGYEINELSWTFNSDHILIATGGSEMGGVDIVSFDGTELTQVLPLLPPPPPLLTLTLLEITPTLPAHTSNCYCLKVDPTYTRMAVGSADFLVSLWDLNDMACHHTAQIFE
jgi:THO complex subunit 3